MKIIKVIYKDYIYIYDCSKWSNYIYNSTDKELSIFTECGDKSMIRNLTTKQYKELESYYISPINKYAVEYLEIVTGVTNE